MVLERMKTNPEVQIECDIIAKRLGQMIPGDFVSYQELSGLIGRNIQNGARSSFYKATKQVDGLVFKSVTGQGYKALKDHREFVGNAESAIKHIRKKAKRAFRELSSFPEYDSLKPEEKTRHCSLLTLSAFISKSTEAQQLKKIEEAVTVSQEKIPFIKTIDLFKSK